VINSLRLLLLALCITGLLGVMGCPDESAESTELATLQITPDPPTCLLNRTLQLSIVGRSARGDIVAVPLNQLTWSVENELIARISASGEVTGLAIGSTTVHVAMQGTLIAASTTLQVSERQMTMLIYMAADNDMDAYGLQDFNELEMVGSTADVSVLVQFDRPANSGSWTEARRFLVQRDENPNAISSPPVAKLGEVDMGHPDTLREFIAWGVTFAPASRYVLVLWNHGNGWNPNANAFLNDQPRSRAIAYDNTSGGGIRIAELSGAIPAGIHLDIVAMDACQMATFEVAYQLRQQADFLVASQEESPMRGFAYDQLLATLVSPVGLAMSSRSVASAIAQEAIQAWASDSFATISALDLSQCHNVAGALDTLALRLIQAAPTNSAALGAARRDTELFDYSVASSLRDLRHYAQRVTATVPGAIAQAQAVDQAAAQMAVANYHNGDHPHANGVSIYLPSAFEFQRLNALTAYRALDLGRNTAWEEWLMAQPE
jgi:hypothetical protein